MALVCYESALQAPSKVIVDMINKTVEAESKARKKTSNAKSEGKFKNDPLCLKVEVSKILTNLSLCEFNLGNFDKSLMYACIAFGIGLDRYKAAYRIAKALEGKGMKQESKDFAAWYCGSHAQDYATQNFSALVEEFGLTKHADAHSSGGAAWIHSGTLKDIVNVSSQVDAALPITTSAINENVIYGYTWLRIKREGNGYFGEKKFLQAWDSYILSLRLCPFASFVFEESFFILSNKGAAWLGLKADSKISSPDIPTKAVDIADIAIGGAIFMFCSSMLNFYENGRAWVRLSRFFVDQGQAHISVEFLKEGMAHLKNRTFKLACIGQDDSSEDPATKALIFVQKELENLHNDQNKEVYKLSAISTEEQLKQRKMHSPSENTFFDGSDQNAMDQQILIWENSYKAYSLANTLAPKSRLRKMKKLQDQHLIVNWGFTLRNM